MPEKQILGFATGDAPRNRTTKDSEHLALLAVNATFDGSGASGNFVPTVVVVSDSGDVVGRFPTAETVAAGDSAEVTFAPFLRREEDFASSGWETVADPAVETLAAGATTALQWSRVRGAHFLEFSIPQQPTFLHAGIYALTVAVRAQGPTPTTLSWTATLFSGNEHGLPSPCIASNVWGTNFNPMNSFIQLTRVWPAAAGDRASVTVANPAAAARDFDFTGLVQRLA